MKKGVQKIYSEVADTYELVNHILTFGLDIHWRKTAAKKAAQASGSLWLDVCSGTGEMAQSLSRLADPEVRIISLDFSSSMLSRAMRKKNARNISFVEAEALRLPFPDDTFDLLTISFATRNINHKKESLIAHLREFHRVLNRGGRFINLETSQPSSRILRRLFHLYIKLTVKPIGARLSGSKSGYSYLAFTIPRFYHPEEFSSLLHQAGFQKVECHRLLFGVSAIHIARK